MHKYLYIATIILSVYFATVNIHPLWASYVEFVYKIDDMIIRSLIFNVVVPWVISLIIYWSLGSLFLLIDEYKKPTSLYETKYQKDAKNTVSLKDCIKQVIFNQVFTLLPGMCILNLVGSVRVTPEIPNTMIIILHLLISSLLGEICYYFSHRLLHTKFLYARIHKRHHNYKAPIAIVSLYAHPLDVLFGNTFALLGPIYLAIILGFIDSLSDHAGYDVKNRFHDIHHQFTNYNFGSIGIFDRWLGTYRNDYRDNCDNRDN